MNEFIQKTLEVVSESIRKGIFRDVEASNLELKDLSTGSNWSSFYESVCSFLNTDGGYVICGIREKNQVYTCSGFNRNDEQKLVDIQKKTFQNDQNGFEDLTDFILLEYEKFENKDIAIIQVRSLPSDRKYVKYKGVFYERQLTGDHKISTIRLQSQREYKAEIEFARELRLIMEASIDDLSLDKVNHFISLLNQSSRKESLKATVESAKEFLSKRHFTSNGQITTLGMLVCGDDPFHFLENRAEVDCYFDTSRDISKDKKIFQDDVLTLMDDAFRFVWGHIRTGRTYEEGGKALPEYPEELIREVINNSLAHRDYSINKFVTITVEPGLQIEIKNPGAFKEKILLVDTANVVPVRRLIPGIPESKNPKLANVLKVFEKLEGQGRGMTALVNYTLDNKIDLPYYDLKDDETVVLTIPSGKLVDEETESWLLSFEKYLTKKLKTKLSDEHKTVITYFRKSELLNQRRLYTILLTESNNHFEILKSLKSAEIITEHPAGTDNSPIYMLSRELMKLDYSDELIVLIGEAYISLDPVAKHMLNIIYRYTNYNEQAVKPAQITPEIYSLVFGKRTDLKQYENLGRKIRAYSRRLSEANIIVRQDKGAYVLNQKFDAKFVF